ncbi:MAG: SoxR reducing system RseC family protein [Bacteroidales bacterium]|nr:SoxR reducing system RseC family protein [Bacteroidales bacterium]
MAELISHKGKVISSGQGIISVEIVSESACSACHAAGLCGMSESRKKIVEVPAVRGKVFSVGQEVEVCLAPKTGLKAVLLSYAIPAMILLILILSLPLIGLGELAGGLLAVAGVALYYLILYLFKGRLAGEYEFYIRN